MGTSTKSIEQISETVRINRTEKGLGFVDDSLLNDLTFLKSAIIENPNIKNKQGIRYEVALLKSLYAK